MRRDFATLRSYRFPLLLQVVGSVDILVVVHKVSQLVDPGVNSDPTLGAGYFPFVLAGMAVKW